MLTCETIKMLINKAYLSNSLFLKYIHFFDFRKSTIQKYFMNILTLYISKINI